MKKIGLFLFLVALTAFAFRPATELSIGAALPKADVKLKDIGGKEISLQQVLDKNGLLVMFSCNTCPYVVKNQARTAEICQYAQTQGVGVAVLNSNEAQRTEDDSFEAMRNYARDQRYRWKYLLDRGSVLADAFGASRTPECFLFDKTGKLVYHGAIDDNPSSPESVTRKHLRMAVDELVAGKEITVKTSRSVGCSIKRVQ